MKKTLFVAIAGFLFAAPFIGAEAREIVTQVGVVETVMEIEHYPLPNGNSIVIENSGDAFILSQSGERKPARDGQYALANGLSIKIDNGKLDMNKNPETNATGVTRSKPAY